MTQTLFKMVHQKWTRVTTFNQHFLMQKKKLRKATHMAAVYEFRGVKNLLSVALINQVLLSHVCPKCPCCLMFDLI